MPTKKSKSRLGRDPFDFVKKTSEEPEPPAPKKKPAAKLPAKPKAQKKAAAAKAESEHKPALRPLEAGQKPAAARQEREVWVEYDGEGTILASLEAGPGESGLPAAARLEPRPNNMVQKFRYAGDLLQLYSEYWVDVSQQPHRLAKR